MGGWLRAIGVVVVLGSGCAAREPSGGTSSSSGDTVGTSTGTATTSSSATSSGTSNSASTSESSGAHGSSESSAGHHDSSESASSAVEETSTGDLHSCPGTGYCDPKPEANVGIYDNHGHTISIVNEHIDACEERDYDIQGEADHSHIITLLPGHYGEIDVGGQIMVTSTETKGHTHDLWSDCE
jgi:hypothetical protein